ncbi:hypothetical protein Q9295_10035 [Xinfangfangia sp. CPCC 101601]|uniref:Uncharacterized protein n=1 Tax=Pseudogemmobacter lacusdianii TaxID=3069608 RepID=A0ABU0VY75_9RHOB|nr:hypothetical protein [Xinfangfangia sp. CPCC 101601]MDQ2066716.1 hypothetical protein [Xinfangfangia sp. CPCC 101601]
MDQSKAGVPDQVRVVALQLAIQAHASIKDGYPDGVICQAREFVEFVTNNDPVLDCGVPEDGVEVDEDGNTVIHLSEYLRGSNKTDNT